MRNKIFLVTTLAAIATGCQSNNEASPDAGSYGEEVSEIKVSDCAAFSAPFSSCPAANKPDSMTDAQKKTQCEAVKTVALNNYETALGKKPDCTDGWVFGPNPVIEPCAKDKDKKVCKLTAKDKSGAGWPTNDTWSECLNDWVVMCTAKYPAAMGIGAKAPVCFHDAIDWDKVGATSVTGREVCQSLVDGKFPPKCDPKLCAPKMKPATKKKGPTACAATFAAGSGSGCEETWSCESCDPATDADCAYDTSCGCVQCEPGEDNPACSEDLVCETPTPTPTPTIEPSPTITPSPTIEPSPTVSPTVSPTPDATPYATPYPTPYATPSPTPYATPYATPFSF